MNAATQSETQAIAETETAVAGFTTATSEEKAAAELRRRDKQRLAANEQAAQPAALVPPTLGSPVADLAPTDAYGRQEPTIGELPADVDTETTFLRDYLCDCWDQDVIADAAYEAVKNFVVVAPPTETSALVLRDPVSQDEVQLGTDAEGRQGILGKANITAAQALSRAQLAATSDLMRTEGIDEVHGTEMDKALLALAAHHLGLKINNKPHVSVAVMEQANAQWEAMLAATAPAAEAVVTAPEAEVATPAAVAEEAPVAAAVEETPVATVAEEAAPAKLNIASAEDVTPVSVAVEAEAAALEAEGIEIPVLTNRLEAPANSQQAKVDALRAEVKAVLAGSNENEAVNPAIYVELVDGLKAGNPKLADKDGFINVRGIREEFQERGIGTGKARRLVEALKADNKVYDSEQTATAPRLVVNYQVAAPVKNPPRVMPN